MGVIRAAAVLGLLALPAQAGWYSDQYCTVISSADRVNSAGETLTTPAQIIQNERANYHLNRHRDPGDQEDSTFEYRDYRHAIPNIMGKNSVGPFLAEDIVNGPENLAICILLQGGDMPSSGMQIEVWRKADERTE